MSDPNRCSCEQARCYPEGPCGHEEVAALRAEVERLRSTVKDLLDIVDENRTASIIVKAREVLSERPFPKERSA